MAVCTLLFRSCNKIHHGNSWQTFQQLLTRNYAKKATAAASAGLSIQPKKKKLPVETDPEKLVRFCCGSNILKEGQDIELGPDDSYPSWLWELPLNGPPPLSEMDPETPEYWESLHRRALLNQNRLLSKRPKVQMRINEKDKIRKLKALRFRALAAYHYDPGVPLREYEEQLKRNRLDW
ncbi:large ribosomal subunit protein mL54 [Dermacentor andersoni]|uniref:large ribosomal subunit protein mL54 n=1 Tax=Dermacentor andersoni TaxID=34620 RepID=UPI002155A8C7|nr:39S ribosomal protein L54, mitochondrial-like [Dermacentor andersoni]